MRELTSANKASSPQHRFSFKLLEPKSLDTLYRLPLCFLAEGFLNNRYHFIAVLLMGCLTTPAYADQPMVAVLGIETPGIDDTTHNNLSKNIIAIVAAEISQNGYKAISTNDIRAMLRYEELRQQAGCEDNDFCMAEIAGALGVDFILAGTVGIMGSQFSVALNLMSIHQAEVKQRFQATAATEDALRITGA